MSLAPGTTLGRYAILSHLGEGGMATVYKAHDPDLDRDVALKVIRTGLAEDREFIERFRREARAVARMSHPNIVQVFDFTEIEDRPVLVMQYLEGGTLKDRLVGLARGGERLPRSEALRISHEVADALTYAHERGIVHRDVKPSNVMLTEGRAIVTDFGIAKIVSGEQLTQTGVGIGTPEYMSPEQGRGTAVDARSDIYSLGVMAYEMFAGRVPFTADTPFAVVAMHMRDPLPPPSTFDRTIGPGTERVLLRALAKDPQERFVSATDFATALEEAARADGGVTAKTVIVSNALRSPAARSSKALASAPVIAGALALLIGGGATVAVVGGAFAGPAPTSTPTPAGTATAPAQAASTSTPTVPTTSSTPSTAGPASSAPTVVSTAVPTRPPALGPTSVVLEKGTISASTEKFAVIFTNFPNGTVVEIVSAKHESGFEQQLNIRFSTNSNPYVIRSDWFGPLGKYTLRVMASSSSYQLQLNVIQ